MVSMNGFLFFILYMIIFVLFWFWPLIILWIISFIYGFKKDLKKNYRPLNFIIFTLIGAVITTFILFCNISILDNLKNPGSKRSVFIEFQPYLLWVFISTLTTFPMLYLGVFIKNLFPKSSKSN